MNRIALVLAAGRAERFGADKLAAAFRGKPLLAHAIAAARAAPVERVIVVTRPGVTLPETGEGVPVEVLSIASDALSDSLKAGIAAADGADAVFVFLGDMPLVPHGIAAPLAAVLGDALAAAPRCDGQPGHPVLLASRAFPAIMDLTGDRGAGPLLRGCSDVVWLDVADRGVLADVDTPADVARLAG